MSSTNSLSLFVAIASLITGVSYGQTLFVPSGAVGASGTGNVGVGTSSPAQKLTIQGGHGDTQLRLFSDNYQQGIDGVNTALLSLWASEPGWTWGGVGIGNNVTNSGGIVRASNTRGGSYVRFLDNTMYMSVIDSSGNDRNGITINSLANVGMGTTSPAGRLHIAQPGGGAYGRASDIIIQRNDAANTTGKISFITNAGIDGTRWEIVSDADVGNDFGFSYNGAKMLQILPSGSVGIGTAVIPQAKLEISQVNPAGWGGNLEGLRITSPDVSYQLRLNSYIVGAGDVGYHFAPNGNSGLALTTLGNVGIGTTNPSHKLAVNGTIKAKEVIVETTGWSDYVFSDDYALAPLAEVEAHIKEHKHLPGIPSAAQVAEQGVFVGDMQAKLLAKIEELTLHQIAQEKRLAEQQTRITALENENRRLNAGTVFR